MKLYTENQIREMMEDDFNFGDMAINYAISSMTPIELPSDGQIENYSMKFYDNNGSDIYFTNGAKWILKQIKKQSNGN